MRDNFSHGASMAFITAVALLVFSTLGTPVSAHGGGPVRAIWDDARGFHMVVESNESPAAGVFGGVVHITMMPTASANAMERLRGMDIQVSATGPDGAVAGPVRAKQILNGPYEADLMVRRSGVWDISIAVTDSAGVQTLVFPLEVAKRSALTDIGIIGGLMIIPVVGILGMVRMSRRRQARTGQQGGP